MRLNIPRLSGFTGWKSRTTLVGWLVLLLVLSACGNDTATPSAATSKPASVPTSLAATTIAPATSTVAATTAVTTLVPTTTTATTGVATTTPPITVAPSAGSTTIAAATTAALPPTPPDNPAIKRDGLTIDFGDFKSQAELSYPASGNGPFPTVVMIAGTGPWGIDFGGTLDPTTGKVINYLYHFRLIADSLNLKGFAVLRYNKHYVAGPGDADGINRYNGAQPPSLTQLEADADKVYAAAKANPKVDPSRIVLYGWSEGTTLATQLGLNHPEIAGLVLQSGPSGSWRDLFTYQESVILAYYHSVLDTNKDGQLSVAEVGIGFQKGLGIVATGYSAALFDPNRSAGFKFSPQLDQNKDGLADIDKEIKPYFDYYIQTILTGDQSIYGSAKALPPIAGSVGKFGKPVLVMQGGHDANVSLDDAKSIDAALAKGGNTDHTLKLYPDLGHELGKSASAAQDNYALIEPAPLDDLAGWLTQHFSARH